MAESADQSWEFIGERHLLCRLTAIKRNVVCPSLALQRVWSCGLKREVFGVPEQDADSAGDQKRGLDDLLGRMAILRWVRTAESRSRG